MRSTSSAICPTSYRGAHRGGRERAGVDDKLVDHLGEVWWVERPLLSVALSMRAASPTSTMPKTFSVNKLARRLAVNTQR